MDHVTHVRPFISSQTIQRPTDASRPNSQLSGLGEVKGCPQEAQRQVLQEGYDPSLLKLARKVSNQLLDHSSL